MLQIRMGLLYFPIIHPHDLVFPERRLSDATSLNFPHSQDIRHITHLLFVRPTGNNTVTNPNRFPVMFLARTSIFLPDWLAMVLGSDAVMLMVISAAPRSVRSANRPASGGPCGAGSSGCCRSGGRGGIHPRFPAMALRLLMEVLRASNWIRFVSYSVRVRSAAVRSICRASSCSP